VRNLPDGRVEAVFEGEEEAVNKVVEWCRVGPSAARVDSLDAKKEKYIGEFSSFAIV
jgi:acylphosphatase